jgi:hypothetical protein
MAGESTQKQLDDLVKRMDAAEAQIRRLRFGVEATPEAIKKAEQGICIFCDKPLDGPRGSRGLHQRCYRKLDRDLPSKDMDWDDAVEAGLCLPLGKVGRKPIPSKLDRISPPIAFDAQDAKRQILDSIKPKKRDSK